MMFKVMTNEIKWQGHVATTLQFSILKFYKTFIIILSKFFNYNKFSLIKYIIKLLKYIYINNYIIMLKKINNYFQKFYIT